MASLSTPPPPSATAKVVFVLLDLTIFTDRKEVVAKVIFSQASVILSKGGVSAPLHDGI